MVLFLFFLSVSFFVCVCVCYMEVFFVYVCCLVLWHSILLLEQTCLKHKAFKNVFALKVLDIDSPPLLLLFFSFFSVTIVR